MLCGPYTSTYLLSDTKRPATPGSGRQVVVVISDGHATEGFGPFDEAERLRKDNVRMISVGITDRINEEELKEMSSPPHKLNEDYYEVPSTETLNAVVSRVATSACTKPGRISRT